MRIVPFITAGIVAAVLYGIVVERDRLTDLTKDILPSPPQPEEPEAVAETAAPAATADDRPGVVHVIARVSLAQEVDSAVLLRGETEAARQVDVQAQTSGVVVSEPLRRGAMVEEGQVLCQIDPGTRFANLAEAEARLAEARARGPEFAARIPEAEARVESARAQLAEAEINANAATKLSEDGYATETRVKATQASVRAAEAAVSSAEAGLEAARSGLDTLQASIESAEASVERAKTEVAHLTITAPFSGLLETDSAEIGSLLSASSPNGAHCATIIQLDPIKIVGFIPETEVGRVEVGARGGAQLTDGRRLVGEVTFLSRSADPLTRTFRVEIRVPNPDLSIRDGQTADIAIESEGAMAHLLPASALTLSDKGQLGVRTVSETKQALFKPVTLLRDTREGIWVTGLSDEETIILVGQEYVTDGVPVSPSYEELSEGLGQ